MIYTMTMKRIASALGVLAVLSLGAFVLLSQTATAPHASYGATNTQQLIGGFPYFLAGSGISSSATSLTLTSLTLPQTGYKILTTDLSNPFYVTFESGNTTRQEFASCTTVVQNANNTATLSGCTRGLLPLAPYTASSTYAFSHSGGTTVIFSNPPQVYNQFYALGNAATSTNTLVFSSTTPPRYDGVGAQGSGTYIATTSELASIAYVNAVTTAGAANATAFVKGLVQLATGLQAASSTALGSTGASLVIPASVATDTPTQSTVSASKVVMSDLTGFIKQGWINLTQSFTFSGGLTSTATTTISASNVNSNAFVANLVKYAFPGSQGSANSRLTNDGSGNLSWTTGATRYAYATTTAIATTNSYATTTQFSVPISAGLLTASSTIHVIVSLSVGQGQAGGSGTFNLRDAAGDTLASCAAASSLSSGGQSGFCVFDIYMNNSASSQIDSVFYSLLGGAGNSSVATVGTTTFNLGSATSLFGVIISSSSSVTVTLGSMVVSITP